MSSTACDLPISPLQGLLSRIRKSVRRSAAEEAHQTLIRKFTAQIVNYTLAKQRLGHMTSATSLCRDRDQRPAKWYKSRLI